MGITHNLPAKEFETMNRTVYHAAPQGDDATGKTLCGRSIYSDTIRTVSISTFDWVRSGKHPQASNRSLCRTCIELDDNRDR